MSERARLETRVRRVRRTVGAWNGVRAASVSAGAIGLALAWGAPWPVALLALPAVAFAARPGGARDAARRLDAAAALDGAIECAWDRRDDIDPVVAAQRARALRALDAAAPARVVAPLSPAWALPALLLAAPLFVAEVEAPRVDATAPAAAADETGDARTEASPAEAAPEAEAEAAKARTSATPRPDAETAPDGDGAGGGGAPTAVATAGGVGARAGDREGGAAGRLTAPRLAGHERFFVDRSGDPDRPRDARTPLDARAEAAVDGRPPRDVVDPARPYPPRHHAVIAAWFERRGGLR